jgi:hypothetical protein
VATSADSAGIEPIVSRSAGREALAKALQLYVGYRNSKRRYTMLQLMQGSGVKNRVIECVMEGADSPEYRKIEIGDLLSLCAFLGPQFITEWLKLSGYGAFELMDGQIPLPKVLVSADAQESPEQERKRLIRRLAELDGVL